MPGKSVIVTHMTTTTTSTSAIILNTGYCKGVHGILKTLQLFLDIICVGILAYYFTRTCVGNPYHYSNCDVDLYFLLVAVACMITTFTLIIASLMSLATASILPKTVFEYLYHFLAFLLFLTAGIAYMVELVKRNDRGRSKEEGYDAKLAAGVMGLIASALYLASAVVSYRVYRIG